MTILPARPLRSFSSPTRDILDCRHWGDREAWPLSNKDWLYLGEALHQVGSALFGGDWKGTEPLAKEASPEGDRLARAMSWLSDRCRANEIVTGAQPGDGTRVLVQDSSLWTAPPVAKRFKRCGYYPFDLSASWSRDNLFAHLFVSKADLTTSIAGLPHTSMGLAPIELGQYSPYLQYAVTLARQWKLTSPKCSMNREEMLAAIKASWAKDRGEELPDITAGAIRQLLRFPNADAIRKGSTRRPNKKRG